MYTPSLVNRPELGFKKTPISKPKFKKLIKIELNQTKHHNLQRLSVVIVAYNERELLLNLITKLLEESNSKRSKIVLVDNGLDRDIKESVKKLPIHYLEATSNLGCTGGRNLASAYVSTPLMSFLDADASIDDNYIDECYEAMSNERVVCARGRVIPLTKGSRVPPSYDLGEKTFPYFPSAEGISIWKSDDFRKAGGFEVDLYGGEGVTLCYRMVALMGYEKDQFIYYPGLLLHHDYNNDTAHLKSKEIRNYTNRWSIDRRYPLLAALITDYNQESRDKRLVTQDTSLLRIQSIVHNAKKEFNEQLDDLYHENLNRRWHKPDSVKNGQKYKFAVILPCYNLGSLLEDAIKSIMRQTLDSIQIIVVDDVSPDESTRKILKALEPHVQVIYRKENGGASAARNTGIRAANADYILCLDSDDTIEPTYLEEAYNIFQMDDSVGVAAPWVKLIGVRNGSWRPKDRIGIPEALLASPIPNASCYRKQAWLDAGGYDESMRGYEDWEYWISILSKGWQIRVIPRPHYVYLTRPDSKVKTSNKNAAKIVSYIVDKHSDLFQKHMTYVISNTHKMHVDAKLKAASNGTPELDLNQYSIFLRGAVKVLRKTETAARVAFVDKDPRELAGRFRRNLRSLYMRLNR